MPTAATIRRDGPLRVFVSYKSEDRALADDLKDSFDTLGGDQIEVFVSDSQDCIASGEDWNQKIRERLESAHLVILLYTDPSRTWDWCLYETGYFDGRVTGEELNHNIIVFHDFDSRPPGPLARLQALRVPKEPPRDPTDKDPHCEKIDVELASIFSARTEPAVNSRVTPSTQSIATLRNRLIAGFSRRQSRREVLVPYIVLRPDREECAGLEKKQFPPKAAILGNTKGLGLFDRERAEGTTWAELIANLRDTAPSTVAGLTSGQMWVDTTERRVVELFTTQASPGALPNFYCPFEPYRGVYRPAITEFQTHSDGSASIEIVFAPLPPELQWEPDDRAMRVCNHLFTLSRNFRWGVLAPFRERLIQVNDPKNRDKWVREFLGCLGSSLADAVNRGFSDEDEALRAFAEEADKVKLGSMATEWRRVLSELKNPDNHRDGAKLRELFNECSKVNYDFMVMILERFKVLLAQEGRM